MLVLVGFLLGALVPWPGGVIIAVSFVSSGILHFAWRVQVSRMSSVGTLKTVVIVTVLVVGTLMGLSAAVVANAPDRADDDGADLDRLDRYDYLRMNHDELMQAAYDMMAGTMHIDCNLLEGQARTGKDLLPLGGLALTRVEITYYNAVIPFYYKNC